MRAGLGRSNDEVEATFAAKRAAAQARSLSGRRMLNKTGWIFGTISQQIAPAQRLAWMQFSAMPLPSSQNTQILAKQAKLLVLVN